VIGASKTLDPIAAAEADIAGSKNLIAAVERDLGQQERWLAHYRLAEKRRERRARIREFMYWLELKRQRLVRWLRRMGLTALRLARLAAAFLWQNAVALAVMLRHAANAALLWARPRIYAAALTLAAWILALTTWVLIEARGLARATGHAAALAAAWVAREGLRLGAILWRWLRAAWAWTKIAAARLARAAIKGASIAAAWSATQSRAGVAVLRRETLRLATLLRRETLRLATSLRRETLRLATLLRRETLQIAAWTRKKTGHFSRASLATASMGFSWTKPASHVADPRHRALAIRGSTALVSFEPRRARLPAINGPIVPPRVNSDAAHASP
jgi:hypothetical protein